MKKTITMLLAYAFLFVSVIVGINSAYAVDTQLGGTGSIHGVLKIWPNEVARQYINGNGVQPNGTNGVINLDQTKIYLQNAAGDNLAEVTSGHGTGQGQFHFEGLPDGTYYLKVDSVNSLGVEHVVLPGADLEMTVFGDPYQNGDRLPIQVANGARVDKIYLGVVHKAYPVKLTTGIGKYKWRANSASGSTEQEGTEFELYRGSNYVFHDPNTNRSYITNLGVLAGDRLNNIRANIPEPFLSDEELAYGYKFAGWKANDSMLQAYPDLADQIFTTEQVMNVIARGDMSWHAVFTYPIHQVTFATDSTKGAITYKGQTGSYVSIKVEGNTSSVPEIPDVTAKDGYKFLGWYSDSTTNVYDPADILKAEVPENITYYAKYEAIVPEVSSRAMIDPIVEGATAVTGTGVAGATITFTAHDGTKTTATAAADGKWSVNLATPAKPGEVHSVQQTEPNKTISAYTDATVIRAIPQKSTNPTINPVTAGDTEITGKGVAGAIVRVVFPDGTSATATVNGDGSWRVPVTNSVSIGQNVSAVQAETDKLASSSVDITVMPRQLDKSATPIIKAIHSKDTKVMGTGVAGSKVSVTFKDGTKVDVTVEADGTWSVDVPATATLASGDNVQAVQLETGKTLSNTADATVIPSPEEKSRHAIVYAVREGDATVTGQGVPGAKIDVTFKDGSVVSTTVQADGSWSVNVPASAALKYGDNVSVVQTEAGKLPSSATDATAVHKDSGSNINIGEGGTGFGFTNDKWNGRGNGRSGRSSVRGGVLALTGSQITFVTVVGMVLFLGIGIKIGNAGRRRSSHVEK